MSFRIIFFTSVLVIVFSACSSENKETPECITAFDCLDGQICVDGKCIKGEAGNTGDTGNTGDSGNTGNTGNTGNSGNSGNTGNTGNSGNTGNTGNTGDTATDPCDPNPCLGISFSDEICTVEGENYSCGCVEGYFWNESLCDDVDECSEHLLNNCSEFADCTNITGSYECECKENYTGDGFDCVADTLQVNCENALPDNASWSSSNPDGSLNQIWDGEKWAPAADECAWECNENYTKSDQTCVADTKTFTCTGKPGSITTVWNSVDKYTQTWDGSVWVPADSATEYNAESSETACRYACAENYTWNGTVCSANTKIYVCPEKPEPGTEWNSVDSYTQTWSGSAWLPAGSSTVYNTTASAFSCRYKCAENFTWNGTICAANTKIFTCAEKPGGITTDWNTVSSYIQTWNGISWEPADSTTEYNPETSETSCRYKCRENFLWNGSICAGDSKTFNCAAKPATGTLWNTVSSYEQIWDGTNWIPAESTTEYNAEPSSEHCRFKCDTNYTWNSGTSTCEANTKPFTCDPKPATGTIWNTVDSYTQTWDGGKWVPDDSDTEYNETASSSACRFKCGDNYTWNSLMCVADSKPFNCAEKPGGNTTVWNTVSGYTQTWSGTAWLPAETSTTYNTTASATECRYKCANNYTWNSGSSTCVADTQTANCTGLPANATWNNVSSINQTWNGTDWAPSSTGTYNITPSSTECRFVCNTNFNWNSPNCVAATQTFSCTAKPGGETTMYNTVSSYTQTWNGSGWLPADDEVTEYNETGSLTSCRYKCADGYTREGENCVISTKTFTCADKPGGTTTVWNTVSSYTQTWNGAAWLPADSTTAYNETGSDSSCRYKCADNHVWDGSSCLACASGWELMNYGTPRCVKAFTDTRTGSSAASYCNTFPTGRLVTILNSNENNFIKNMISGHSWIGLADATEIEQTAALVNVGSSYSSSANPYWFGAYGGQIKGNTVSNNNYFKLTTNEAKMYSFALYGLSADLDLFLYASDCSTLLTSWIESGSELGSYNLAAGTTYCIKVGYNNNSGPYILAVNYSSEDDQYFSWLSGSLYNYHNWNSGEPNNYDEYCTQLYTTGFWNDLDCSDSLQYVCERNPGS